MTGFYVDKVKIRRTLFLSKLKKSSANIFAPKTLP